MELRFWYLAPAAQKSFRCWNSKTMFMWEAHLSKVKVSKSCYGCKHWWVGKLGTLSLWTSNNCYKSHGNTSIELLLDAIGCSSSSSSSLYVPWRQKRLSVANLSSENNLLTFQLNAPVVIRAKVKKCEQTLLFIAEAN